MLTSGFRAAAVAMATAVFGCAPTPAPRSLPSPGEPSAHHHELHLPPVGPEVHVGLDGKGVDVALASLSHVGSSARLVDLWKAAFPGEDAAALHFDLVGSDGFHPAARAKCARLLGGTELAAARIDVVSHDVSFDEGTELPGCYRVKAVVRMDATR